MRARLLAAASSITLGVAIAGCGGSDAPDQAVAVPTANAQAVPTSPTTDVVVPTSDADASTPQKAAAADLKPIPELISENPDLATLKTALGAADITATLAQAGPYTVFAPGNDAFTKLGSQLDTLLQPSGKDDLANILKFHVVSGTVSVKDLKDGQLLTTLQGTRLRVTRNGTEVSVGNSRGDAVIVSQDLPASNGVVHEIDTVLTPKPAK